MKICPVGDEMFCTDKQTYMAKLKVTFCDFANAPNNRIK
jgi:hypothetical protein